jgi:hypothetical protein
VVLLPPLVFWITKRACEELRRSEAHPTRGWDGRAVRRLPSGGFDSGP